MVWSGLLVSKLPVTISQSWQHVCGGQQQRRSISMEWEEKEDEQVIARMTTISRSCTPYRVPLPIAELVALVACAGIMLSIMQERRSTHSQSHHRL